MPKEAFRPALRAVETIVVPDERHGRVVVLRDTQGVTAATAAIPPPLVPIVSRFDGTRTCAEIAREASAEIGEVVPTELVTRLARELDEALFLDGPRFREALVNVRRTFADAAVRPASHAGGAYHLDAAELRTYLDDRCLGATSRTPPRAGALVALVAPHIDPWRGAIGYGHAYGAMKRALASQEVDTFIVLGTSHAAMREPFALCRKGYDTPLGVLEPDLAGIDAIAAAAAFDPYADQFNHKREHSIEFQAVFLKHLVGERPARIVPVLAGLGEHQARRTDPARDGAVKKVLGAIAQLIEARGGRAVLVAGADFAHIGPRFGDERPDGAQLQALDATDRDSIACAVAADARGFWEHVAGDLDTRRVCGLAPIYSLLSALPKGAAGDLLHYEQTVDKDDGSVVSHAALGFYV